MFPRFLRRKSYSVILLSVFLFWGCSSSDDGGGTCLPQYNISISINVNLPLYSQLVTGVGWTYVSGEGAGPRGLIVVNTGTGFKAYDRNAPHICPTANSTLEVVDDMMIYCPEDEAEWILLTGQPLKVADRPPRTYQAVRNGDIITIFN